MRVVVLTPYRPADRSRERVWRWVRGWIDGYGYPVVVGDSDGAVFSRAQARNNAARLAGDWDVAVFHDADTIAHPAAVAEAVEAAANSRRMVVAGDAHMYCDRASSERIMAGDGLAFARPASFDEHGIYERPCSGVFAVSRTLFDAVGGYVESLAGWGYEDLAFLQCCGLFGGGNTWVSGHITLHLWHEPARRDARTAANQAVWTRLARHRARRDAAGAREYLASLGHHVP